MPQFKTSRRALLAGAAATLAAPGLVRAQDAFPNKQIKFIVPYTPAGATDNISRIVMAKVSEMLGQQVLIDNRAGGGGTIGTDALAKAAPDGYTIGLITISMFCMAPALYSKLPYDPVKDFSPMAGMSVWPNMLVVHPSIPAKTVPELIALLKANPGKYNMASSGSGTTIHLAGEMFKQLTGTDMVHVPYKGSAGAMQDLIAGNVHIMFDNMPSCWPHVQAGKLRALGVTSRERNKAAPDVPAIIEFVPNYVVEVWMGFGGPADVPQPIVDKLAAVGTKALEDPDVKAKFAALGSDPWPMAPKGLQDRIVSEIAVWAPIVKASGAKVDG
ncbi:tripartite tricarboxylate transporter substrate binding protein [uncultured Reyranella sp.]|uniref:Bug family tripartite tricarboxylate transporter substrate binding protein n=1 Tax=uncultured Reyranella sp. TaxID=735512 RepID=UPI0025D97F35|nr:tripartite tricarboxylate transporter substrate binding protein [uncultured Reyranella sp.]